MLCYALTFFGSLNLVVLFELQMMLYGGIFSCLSPILTISAFLSYKSPFVHPRDEVIILRLCKFFRQFIEGMNWQCNVHNNLQRENVDRAKLALLTDKVDDTAVPVDAIRHSDHLVMLIAYQKWDKILTEVCLSIVFRRVYLLFSLTHLQIVLWFIFFNFIVTWQQIEFLHAAFLLIGQCCGYVAFVNVSTLWIGTII